MGKKPWKTIPKGTEHVLHTSTLLMSSQIHSFLACADCLARPLEKPFIGLVEGKNHRNPPYLMVKTMVSCIKWILKPIQWTMETYGKHRKTKGKPSWDVYIKNIYIYILHADGRLMKQHIPAGSSTVQKLKNRLLNEKKHALAWFSGEWNHINGSPSIGVFFLWTGDGTQNKTRTVTPRQRNYVQSLVVHKEYMLLLLIIIGHSNKNANEFLPSPRRYPRSGMKETKSVTRPKPWMIVTHDHRHWISLHHLHNLRRLSQIPSRKKRIGI